MDRMDMNKWRKLGLDGTERNSEKIEKFASEKGIDVVKKIPFSKCIIDSVVRGEIPADNCPELRVVVENLINNF